MTEPKTTHAEPGSMVETTRTFIAVEVSEAVRRKAVALMADLPLAGVKVSRVPPENLHLTLRFLGDLPAPQIAEVSAAVEAAVQGHAPFRVRLRGLGAFPSNSRPGTIWLGVDEGADRLEGLACELNTALRGLGIPKERRAFHPHLTLGRVRHSRREALARLAEALRSQAEVDAGACDVRLVIVFASHLSRAGAVYEALQRVPLSGS